MPILPKDLGQKQRRIKLISALPQGGLASETQNHLLYGSKINYFEQEKTKRIFKQKSELIENINKLFNSLPS